MTRRTWTALCVLGVALGGCGLKGPLYLPEKSEVKIRPAPAGSAPAKPAESPAPASPATPEQPKAPEQTPQPPAPGPDRG